MFSLEGQATESRAARAGSRLTPVRRRHRASRGGVFGPRRWGAPAVVLLALVAGLSHLALGQPAEVSAGSSSLTMVDAGVDRSSCALLGRTWTSAGCRRDSCARSADAVRTAVNAEVCQRGGLDGSRYGTPVPAARCRALHRRFVAAVNLCASSPRRDRALVARAPECVAPWTTYAVHSERDGDYDECLRPRQARRWEREALRRGEPVAAYLAARSPTLCSFRARAVYAGGRCRRERGPLPTSPEGTLLLGDSVAWRAADELADLRPDWELDAVPGRLVDDLRPRLDRYLADHRPPAVLVVALGTNPGGGWVLGDYLDAVAPLPAQTRVVWVTPHRETHADRGNPSWLVAEVRRVQQAMRRAAAIHPGSCVVDWSAAVQAEPDLLLDGVHPTRPGEQEFARLVARGATRCLTS